MKEQRITISIDAEGRISADAEGFTGDACLKELERLLADLAPTASLTRKPEGGAARVSLAAPLPVGKKR